MLELRDITKRFDAVYALDNASFKIMPGEIQALLGANGSGKSTMVKVLGGLVNPNKGSVLMDGEPVQIRSSRDSKRMGIAVAYQDLSLIPAMSVIDNIVLGIEPTGLGGLIKRKKAVETALEVMKKLKINCDPNALIQTLMPSTQSMIEIAKAIVTKPRLLILDEATASLHSDEVDALFEVLEELKAEGCAIVVVTHRMDEIYRICDTCTILRSGKTVMEGPISELPLDEIVFHMTGKRPEAAQGEHLHTEHGADDGTQPVLEVKNLGLFPRFSGINMHVNVGEIVGIGGLDGQGQSDFLRAVLGDRPFESGEMVFGGKSQKFRTPADAVCANVGFISGDRAGESVFPIRSVAENIYAAATAKGKLFAPLPPKKIREFSEDAIEVYGVKAGSTKHAANTLSGGNQQKLVLSRWLALSPELLLLDDPTKGVDINARQEIHKIIRECAQKGMAVIYISSDNAELLEISDRVYVFYEGEINAELRGENIVEEKLVAAMLGLSKKSGEKTPRDEEVL